MSGSTIGGLAGAVVGIFVPFIGPALGATIGQAVGGLVAPTVIEGQDPGQPIAQSVQPGQPRAVVFGHCPPFPGVVIGGEKVARKITEKHRQGKGGPTVKETKFLLTSAIGVGEGPARFIRIWRDGVVVLDRRTVFPEGWEGYSEEIKTAQAKFLESARLYEGSDDQLPDPALEAIHGVGNTPYFRGTCYIVDEDVDRTATRGTVAQYLFEMASCGEVNSESTDIVDMGPEFYYPFGDAGSPAVDISGKNRDDIPFSGGYSFAGGGVTFDTSGSGGGVDGGYTDGLADGLSPAAEWSVFCRVQVHSFIPGMFGDIARTVVNSVNGWYNWALFLSPNGSGGWHLAVGANNSAGAGTDLAAPSPIATETAYVFGAQLRAGNLELLINGAVVASTPAPGTLGGAQGLQIGDPYYGHTANMTVSHLIGFRYAQSPGGAKVVSYYLGNVPDAWEPIPDAPGSYYDTDTGEIVTPGIAHQTVDECALTLQEVEEAIAERCNVPADRIDCSALGGIELPGYLLLNQQTGKAALGPLMLGYFHDLPEYDGEIHARLRGGPVAFNIEEALLLASGVEDDVTRPQGMEYPRSVTVFTQEPEAEYGEIPQTSIRTTPDVRATGEVVLRLPVPLGADEAKQVAEKLHAVLWSQAEGQVQLSLGPDYASLIASDPFTFDSRRWLCMKADYIDGTLHIEADYESALNYTSTATGTVPDPPAPPTGVIKGPTIFMAMNLPSLRAQDNGIPGAYIAAMGRFPAGWPGADIYLTTPDGTTSLVATITQPSILGQTVGDEESGGEPITVRLNSADDELDNATTAQVAAGVNAAAIVSDDDYAEIIGFEDANQETGGDWDLSTITRGELATPERTYLDGDRFGMLENVQFLPIASQWAEQTLVFRAVTIGTAFDMAPAIPFVYRPNLDVIVDGGDLE